MEVLKVLYQEKFSFYGLAIQYQDVIAQVENVPNAPYSTRVWTVEGHDAFVTEVKGRTCLAYHDPEQGGKKVILKKFSPYVEWTISSTRYQSAI